MWPYGKSKGAMERRLCSFKPTKSNVFFVNVLFPLSSLHSRVHPHYCSSKNSTEIINLFKILSSYILFAVTAQYAQCTRGVFNRIVCLLTPINLFCCGKTVVYFNLHAPYCWIKHRLNAVSFWLMFSKDQCMQHSLTCGTTAESHRKAMSENTEIN